MIDARFEGSLPFLALVGDGTFEHVPERRWGPAVDGLIAVLNEIERAHAEDIEANREVLPTHGITHHFGEGERADRLWSFVYRDFGRMGAYTVFMLNADGLLRVQVDFLREVIRAAAREPTWIFTPPVPDEFKTLRHAIFAHSAYAQPRPELGDDEATSCTSLEFLSGGFVTVGPDGVHLGTATHAYSSPSAGTWVLRKARGRHASKGRGTPVPTKDATGVENKSRMFQALTGLGKLKHLARFAGLHFESWHETLTKVLEEVCALDDGPLLAALTETTDWAGSVEQVRRHPAWSPRTAK